MVIFLKIRSLEEYSLGIILTSDRQQKTFFFVAKTIHYIHYIFGCPRTLSYKKCLLCYILVLKKISISFISFLGVVLSRHMMLNLGELKTHSLTICGRFKNHCFQVKNKRKLKEKKKFLVLTIWQLPGSTIFGCNFPDLFFVGRLRLFQIRSRLQIRYFYGDMILIRSIWTRIRNTTASAFCWKQCMAMNFL